MTSSIPVLPVTKIQMLLDKKKSADVLSISNVQLPLKADLSAAVMAFHTLHFRFCTKLNIHSVSCQQHVFPLPFAFADSTSSVRSQAWRSWMTLRSWRRREPRLEKPTGCSRAATAAGRGGTCQRDTHRKSQTLSEEHRIKCIYEPFPLMLHWCVFCICLFQHIFKCFRVSYSNSYFI